MRLDLTEAEAESLRRSLWGWTLTERDRDALKSVERSLGRPRQRPEDRVPELRDPNLRRALGRESGQPLPDEGDW